DGIAAMTHIATGRHAPVDYRAIPRATYTHPEAPRGGLNMQQAAEMALARQPNTRALSRLGRDIHLRRDEGTVNIVVEKDGPIVGASVVGPQAGEMIHELMYAVGWEALPAEAAAFIHGHPTLSEAVGETLLTAAGRSLH